MFNFLIVSMLVLCMNIYSQTNISSGNVSGNWNLEGSPYLINGNITIPNTETLVIDPGVDVLFQGHYSLAVNGRLLAEGTLSDSIKFSITETVPTTTGWIGIKFVNTSSENDSSKISYSVLEYAINIDENNFFEGSAVRFDNFSKARVSHSNFRNNRTLAGGGIKCINTASPTIEHCFFLNNSGDSNNPGGGFAGGIAIMSNSAPIVRYNSFTQNGAYSAGAIGINEGGDAKIYNNHFYENGAIIGGALYLLEKELPVPTISGNIIENNESPYICGGLFMIIKDDITILVSNNTIVNNTATYGGGAYLSGDNIKLINNILYHNSGIGSQVCLNDIEYSTSSDFYNCIIEGGVDGFGYDNGGSFEGEFIDCLDIDPDFVDFVECDFHLSDTSPLIGAGVNQMSYNGINFYAFGKDIDGIDRPYPVLTNCDIGAYENTLAEPIVDIYENEVSKNSLMSFNYPDPFNPTTTICFDGRKSQDFLLTVYNLSGQIVFTSNYISSMSENETISFNGQSLTSGIYVYTIIGSNKEIISGKMTLLK
ncbi:MAG: T9SS type A sorting domain-containing protein [Candidatus Delongbacteria bacterium]|nr:T9SS type A sorting domain-containing protein [Candidatus Delongbacteria bacterium]MBN2834289.1 T9SS type A sorting domain-containing protein [Candidatus Delongbacteria bacterium]